MVVCSPFFWDGFTALTLFLTLICVISYAHSSYKLTKHQEKDIWLRNRPVVSFTNRDRNEFFFRTFVHNHSNVHAKYRAKATISIEGYEKPLKLDSDHHYAGTRTWTMQAQYGIGGHLDMDNVLRYNNILAIDPRQVKARVIIESWVINYYESEHEFNRKESRNPVVQYDWSPSHKVWIPEVAPAVD